MMTNSKITTTEYSSAPNMQQILHIFFLAKHNFHF